MAKLRRRADRPGARRRRSLAEPLEPRILLSADLPGVHDEPALPAHGDPVDGRHELVLHDESPGTTPEQHTLRRELVFVDAGIEGYEQLVDDLRERDAGDATVDVYVLEKDRDGIATIGEALASHDGNVDAVHVISHGSEGGLQLGGTWLTSDSLASRAASLAGWSGAFADGADLLLYGCDLAGSTQGQQLVGEIATLTGADVAASADLTGAAVFGGDWELEYATGSVETVAALGGAAQPSLTGVLNGTAIWSESGSPVPASNEFDDTAFLGQTPTAAVDGTLIVMDGAESPTRDEMIVLGVDVDGKLSGQMWDGTDWSALPFNSDLPKVARNDLHGFDVAYDSQSGDAMLVYNNGVGGTKSISYRIWDGANWADPEDIALPAAGQPDHIQLAAKPGSKEMILVAGNDAKKSYALVWDGSNWGNAASLHDGNNAASNTDVSVAYEQQSGHAMVVYAKDTTRAHYRIWNGSGWGAEGPIDAPIGATDQPRWTALASDPTSDRIALGVITDQKEVWLDVWNGDTWQPSQLATTDSPHNDRPNVAVAFEAQSGQAIATYATSGSRITYRTWSVGGGWSNQRTGPDLGYHADAVTLDADPYSNQVMLSVVEQLRAVSFVAWDGGAWGTPNELEVDTGTNKGQPFVFLWDQQPPSGKPTADASQGAPYVIDEGDSVTLDGSNSSDPESQALSYQWDLDGDGDFDEPGEPTGAKPVVPWATLRNFGIDNDGAYQIGLRVTDTDAQSDTATTTLMVNETAPTINVSGARSVEQGQVYTLNLSASDPGSEAILGWNINWGDGTVDTVGDVSAATHVYDEAGFTRNITVSVEYENGTWTNSDLLVGNWVTGADAFHRFDGSTGSFESTSASSGDLDRPYAVTVGPDGNYYVSGYDSNNIGRFDSAGNYLGEFIAPGTAGLNQPDGLAWGPDGNLYVANYWGNNILRFDASGGFIDVFGLGIGGMNGPTGLAFGPDGDLYAASWNNSKLVKYDGVSGGAPITVINSGLSQPEQIVFDAAGNLYIADGSSDSVKMWDGSSLTTYFTHPDLSRATGLTFGPDGALYVGSYSDNLILRYDGSTGEVFVSTGSGSLVEPEYLHFTPELQVYVTGVANTPTVTDAVTEMDVQTTSGLVIDRNAADGAEVNWFKITGIANGTLYQNDGTTPINDGDFITFAEANAGLRFTPDPGYAGSASILVQASITGDDAFLSPAVSATITVGAANLAPTADATGGAPYVIRDDQSLQLDGSRSFDPEGGPLTYEWDLDNDGDFSEAGEPTGASPLVSAAELDGAGMGDDGSHVIGLRVTDAGGASHTTTTGVWVGDTTQTVTVTGAPSTVEGDVYTLNLAAQVPGSAARSWTINWGDGTIDTLGDVASATHVYSQPGYTRNVTVSVSTEIGTWTNSDLLVGSWEAGVDAVHLFDGTTGDLEFVATSSGGVIQRPSTIVIGPDGSFYVSGYDSHNIGRYDSSGSYVGEFIPSGTPGLVNPDGLAFGADGNLYVATAGGNDILRFDASGGFIDVFGSGGDLDKPTGIAFGPDGDLYVASWNNGKVLKLDGDTGGTPLTVIDSGLTEPEEILFDSAGNLYISDGATSSVQIWDGSSLATHFSDPALVYATGITFGPDGALYVASHNNDQILRYDGIETQIFVTSGSDGLNQPEYLLFSPELQVRVTHRAEEPTVTAASTPEDVQSASGLVLDRNAADGAEVTHFKVTGITNGTLYHNDGTTPINDGDFITWAEGNAGLKFTPDPNYFGAASFDVQASSTGDDSSLSTAAAADITVTPVNDAPVLDASGAMMLADVLEGDSDPAGNSVASIIASAGGDRITDVDPGALEGIAVIGVDDSNGTWEYSTDGGASWSSFTALGVPSASTDDTAAVLLADDALVRFVPAVGHAGSAGNITFRAWDRTDSPGPTTAVDVSGGGSSSPYSSEIETASLTVVPAANVAHLVPGAQSTDEDTPLVFSNAGGNAVTVNDGSGSDVELQTTLSVSNGTLTLAGTTGLSFVAGADGTASMTIRGTESALNAALDGLAYTPDADYAGSADLQLTTRLWDPDLLALYTFDGANPVQDDGALPASDGILQGGVGTIYDAARGGNVMDFDGSNDSVRIPGLFGEPASLTLAAWVNLDSGFINGEVISLGNNVALRVDHSGGGDFGVIGFFWDGSSFQHTDSNLFINGTGWRHVAFAFDDANDLQTVYIDGAPMATSALSQSISYAWGTDTYLGRHGASGTYYLNGKLDDVRVYDRALAGSEVAALFDEQTSATDSVAITVNPVNDAPQGTDATVGTLEDTPYTFSAADFGFSDPVEGNAFAGVFIDTAPGAGTLRDGVTILSAGDSVSAASIAAGNLIFTPAPDASGSPHASFTFQVRDDGGTLNGGVDLAPGPNTMTIDVTPVNDPPVAADDSATVAEGATIAIDLAANDSDVDNALDLTSLQIVSGPASGSVIVNPDGTVDYTHDGSETNADSFSYRIRDAAGRPSNTATVSLTVTPVNDAPQASPDWSLVAEGGTVTIDLAANDSDADDGLDLASIQIVSGPASGSVIVNADGTVDYTHDGSETFTDAFSYTIRDLSGAVSNTQTVLVGVWPVDDVPTAADDSATVAEGGSVTIDLAANDSDPDDGLNLASIQIISGPANGSLVVNGDGTVDYAHDGSETNADSFTYTIRDAGGQVSGAATVSLTVTPVSDAPAAADDSASVAEGGSVAIDLAANDSDSDDGLDLASIQIVSGPANGSLAVNANGSVDYTHDGSETSADSFTYTIRDAGGQPSNPATVWLTVTPVNDAPAAADDSASVAEGGSVAIDLAANDSDPDDGLDLASIQIVSGPANGSLAVNANGSVDYTHDGSETSADSFTYTIRDAAGQVSGAATVSLSVTPVNDAPTATDDTAIVAEGGSVNIDLAANDSDPDDGLDLASIQIVSGPANGSLVVNPDGTVDYSHDGSETNADSFTYTIRDAGGQVSNTATVSITVTPVNDAPAAADDSASVAEGGSVAIDLAANDSDPDDGLDLASIQIVSGPANGSLVVNPDGTVDYSHDGSETNADSFTYTIRDAGGQVSNTATVSLAVTPVNDAPAGADNTVTTLEDSAYTFTIADFGFSDPAEGDALLGIVISTAPATGILRDGAVILTSGDTVSAASIAAGNLVFTPDPDAAGAGHASFRFQVRDDGGTANGGADLDPTPNTITIDVTTLNDAPVLVGTGPSLGSITEDDVGNRGETVATILGSSVSDADAGANEGIAITRLSSGNGTWQYSTDGGASWAPVGPVGNTSALLLRDADRIRFVPDGENADSASFDFRAWDRTTGVFASKANATAGGGGYAFSSTGDTASIAVSALNDAPGLQSTTIAPVTGDPANAPGESVGSLFAGRFSDVDSGARMSGIAVVGNGSSAATEGTWQYSSDGGATWFAVGSVADDSRALALNAGTRLRFVPADAFVGTPTTLLVRALDDSYAGGFSSTAGGSENRTNVDTGASGGTSSISGTTASVSTEILTAWNPTLGDPDPSTPPPDDSPEPGDDPGPDTGEEPETPAPDSSIDSIPLGALPEGPELAPPFGARGTSSQPFSDASTETTRFEVESGKSRALRADDSRAEKAEDRANTEAREDRLGYVPSASELARELDRLRREVEVESLVEQQLFGSSIALTAGLSIGYIVWLTRGGLLIASLVSSMPVWRLIDPVPILAGLGTNDEDGEQAESLDSMLAAEPPDEGGAGGPPPGADGSGPAEDHEGERRRGS